MRHIGEVDTPQQANEFLSYLLVNGIQGHSDAVHGKVEVWVKEEDQLGPAVKELALFKQNPLNPKYASAVPEATRVLKAMEQRKREIQARIVSPSSAGSAGAQNNVTKVLIGISVLVALVTNFGQQFDSPVYRFCAYTSIGPLDAKEMKSAMMLPADALNTRTLSLQRGEVWRLITPIFIHYGIMHIVFNLWWLVSLGTLIEKRYGWKSMLLLVLVTAVFPNLVQCIVPVDWQGSAPQVTGDFIMTHVGGMSGVIYGLFGFVWMKSIFDRNAGFRLPESTVIIMLVWLVACIFGKPLNDMGINFIPSNVANWAHGIGLLVGVVAGYLSSRSR